jgi:hypothetical protein
MEAHNKKYKRTNKSFGFLPLRACLDAYKHPKFFAQYPSHRIFGHMHGALNVDKKNN